ncbi:MAG: S1 RNA-binding domain-containing protein [Caldilineaceae bacterium]
MTEQSETVVAETENTEETVSVDGETAGDAVEVTAASTVATAAASETSEESVAEAPATEITAEAETEAQAEAEESSTAAATSTGEPVAEDTSVTTAATDATAPSVAEAETDGLGDDETLDEEGRVVKLLAVGQKVTGVVRRITDFGAFVDIGVGRDGLIHVSELSIRRVGKVSDVLQENEEVEAWIKKLDRSRNRISLTLVEPGTKTIRDLEKDELVNGTVTRILPYGAFVDIGIGRARCFIFVK